MVIDIGALKIALKRTMLGLVVIGLKDLGKKSFPETARANNKGKLERPPFHLFDEPGFVHVHKAFLAKLFKIRNPGRRKRTKSIVFVVLPCFQRTSHLVHLVRLIRQIDEISL